MLTCRSNVYAMWLTVGYFEVNSDGNGGTKLGYEIGSDTGETKRRRAFYVVDRTIPVAYERGQNHNIDRAILVRRYLQ